MRLPQATTPRVPQAPPAPQAPTTAPPAPPTPEQVQQQIKEQVRKSVEDARAQARQARIDAQKAREDALRQGLPVPVIVDPGHTGTMLPPTWPEIQGMVENVTSYFFIAVCVIAIGVPLARAFARRLGPAPVAPPLPREVIDQLRRIEHSVESMAIEIERVSEAQRFLTKLNAGKQEAASLPPRSGA